MAGPYLSKLEKILDQLPLEITVREAAEILNVDVKTVHRLIADGDLPARNAAPSRSTRTQWRIPLDAVVAMRTDYQRHTRQRTAVQRVVVDRTYQPRHVKRPS